MSPVRKMRGSEIGFHILILIIIKNKFLTGWIQNNYGKTA
jgi:hypothetical protein